MTSSEVELGKQLTSGTKVKEETTRRAHPRGSPSPRTCTGPRPPLWIHPVIVTFQVMGRNQPNSSLSPRSRAKITVPSFCLRIFFSSVSIANVNDTRIITSRNDLSTWCTLTDSVLKSPPQGRRFCLFIDEATEAQKGPGSPSGSQSWQL